VPGAPVSREWEEFMDKPKPAVNETKDLRGEARESKPLPSAQSAVTPPQPQHQVVVRFLRPMKLQRVQRVVVQLHGYPRGRPFAEMDDVPVLVRLSIPGALVTPTEAPLDATQPGSQTTFYVTPLARGRLRDAKVEVRQRGRLLQEIPLPVKGSSQRLTWVL